jgi:exopolysaccharide biosynthesis protein
MFSVLLILGIALYIRNIKIRVKAKVPKFLKYMYIAFLTMYATGCVIVLTLLYGPVTDFKDWLVTTAMQTMTHKHYCQWFYSQKEIDEVFSRNYLQEPEGSTDESLVDTDTITLTEYSVEGYANEYEKAVLEREEGNPYYKIINLNVNGCKGYLAVIYDPSMVHVTTTNKVGVSGQYVTTMAKREKAFVAINGAGFHDPGYSSSGGCPKGITIVNGKIITNNEYGRAATGGLIGLTNDNKLVLLRNVTAQQAIQRGVRDAVSWGPFLVVNGKAAYSKGNGGWGKAARTAIGQRKDGIILMLVVDSNYNRTKGADMGDMADIMVKYGAINATNLDGGTSSVMAVDGELISHPVDSSLKNETRPIATAFVVRK